MSEQEPQPTVVQARVNLDGKDAYIVTGGPGPAVTPDGAPFTFPAAGGAAAEPEPEAG